VSLVHCVSLGVCSGFESHLNPLLAFFSFSCQPTGSGHLRRRAYVRGYKGADIIPGSVPPGIFLIRVHPSLPPTLTSARPPTRVWEVVHTVAAPPSIVVECGGWFFVWSFVALFLSCRVLCSCGVVLVASCVVLFVLCVCVCDLFLFLHTTHIRCASATRCRS